MLQAILNGKILLKMQFLSLKNWPFVIKNSIFDD